MSRADEQAVREALEATGTQGLAAERLDRLSGGRRQRCWLAMVLAQHTPVALLDEPTSALDLGHVVAPTFSVPPETPRGWSSRAPAR